MRKRESVTQNVGSIGDPRIVRELVSKFADSTKTVSGKLRSSRKPMYHKVPIELMQAVAEACEHGDLKYEPGSWRRGEKAFFVDCLNHAIEHLFAAADNESSENVVDNLGHAAANIGFILHALRVGMITRADFHKAAELFQDASRIS